jgi:hypothetical protein
MDHIRTILFSHGNDLKGFFLSALVSIDIF